MKRFCWCYSDSADGDIASELIATFWKEELKAKVFENVLAGVHIDIMYTLSVGV